MRIRMMTSFFVSCWLAKGYGKRKGIASLTPPITERMGHIYASEKKVVVERLRRYGMEA